MSRGLHHPTGCLARPVLLEWRRILRGENVPKPLHLIATALLSAPLTIAAAAAPVQTSEFRWLTIDGAAVRWHPGRSSAMTLRYAFARSTSETPGAVNCSPLTEPARIAATERIGREGLRRAAAQAFARWEAVTPIRFVAVENDAAADIVIGEQVVPKGYAFTNLTLAGERGDKVRAIARATICLNPTRSWKIGFDGNLASYDLVHTLTHEIGHAIGLDHPGPRGHLMSFRYDEKRDGLSPGDVLGANVIYGSPAAQQQYWNETRATEAEQSRSRSDQALSRALSSPRRD